MFVGDPETITDKELVENTGSVGTVPVAQIERLLQVRTKNALVELREQVKGLTTTLYRASEGLKEKADGLIALYNKISNGQSRQQLVVICLTLVIAASTLLYTWITWKSVEAMQEANE